MSEAEIQREIRLAIGRDPRRAVLWRNSTGVTGHAAACPKCRHVQSDEDTEGPARITRYGLAKGSSDLIGISAPSGRFLALEVKTPVGRLSEDQRIFLALVRARGGFAAVVRSPEDAIAALARAERGESE